jgi:hypothetical protein
VTLKVAFFGRTMTGKGTRVAALEQALGFGEVLEFSFAAPLKGVVAEKHGISVAELEVRKAEFREELQETGMRGREDGTWVRAMARALAAVEVEEIAHGKPLFRAYAVGDGRFQDELDLLKGDGFYCVHLVAPREVLESRYLAKFGVPLSPERYDHPSEAGIAGLVGFDAEWDATLDPLAQVRALVLARSLSDAGQRVKAVAGALSRLFGPAA